MTGKSYRLLLLRNHKSTHKEIRFSKVKLILYSSLLSVVCLALICGSVYFLANLNYSLQVNRLKNETMQIRQNISDLNEKSQKIRNQIDILITMDDDLRRYSDLPSIDEVIRDVGVGGSEESFIYLSPFYDEEEANFNNLKQNFDKYLRIINLQKQSSNLTFKTLLEMKAYSRYFPFYKPVDGGRVTTEYGYRTHPVTKKIRDFHHGIDIGGLSIGTPVVATADGVVVESKYHSYLGNFVKIDHNSKKYGFHTLYGHLKKRYVNKGDIIKRGDIIGELGDTGRTTAHHLHYEVHKNGRRINPLQGYYQYKNSY